MPWRKSKKHVKEQYGCDMTEEEQIYLALQLKQAGGFTDTIQTKENRNHKRREGIEKWDSLMLLRKKELCSERRWPENVCR
ncbi:MAG: hypothetical protein ACLVAW_13390 [Eisenbergiella massiliensis]